MEATCGNITEAYLNRLYEDLLKEQMMILAIMKKGSNLEIKDMDKNKTKEIHLLNDLMLRILKFRTFKQMLATKMNV